MTGARVCEQCKKACNLCRKGKGSRPARSTPSRRSSPPRCCKPKDKPIYVAADPADQTSILLGPQTPGAISLRFSGNTSNLKVCMPDLSKTNGGQRTGARDIEIKGSSIVKTGNGLQIMPCKAKAGGGGGSGGVQISVARSEGGACGGGVQLSFGEKAGQPSIMCESGTQDLEITFGPDTRKLNMNHTKPTVASLIAKRMTELEIERRLTAELANEGIHKRRC